MVVETAERDDHIFAGRSFGQLAFEAHFNRTRDLPPEFARGPNGSRIRAHDRCADRAERTVHVRVRVGRHNERPGHDVTALDHDLVPDARTGGIEVDAVLFGEGFDSAIFLLIRFVLVLDIVVERKDELFRIMNFLSANAFKLAHHGGRIVVGHNAMRANREKVSRAQRPRWALGHVALSNFFNNSLRHT